MHKKLIDQSAAVTPLRIALVYEYNENWLGGTYYIQNVIHALKKIDDEEKPRLVIFASEADYNDLKSTTGYPYLQKAIIPPALNPVKRAVNKVLKRIFNRKLFDQKVPGYDVVFPFTGNRLGLADKQKFLYWIPDLQEHFLPEFFSSEEINFRKQWQRTLSATANHIVFSSQSALSDFRLLYPESLSHNYVLKFAVTHPTYQDIDLESLKNKYGIKTGYFITSNQFWKHKNHLVIIKAVSSLKQKGIEVCVVFTGKTEDYRNPGYYEELRQFTMQEGIQEHILFLGLVDRKEQLRLMKGARAIIQPSKFEGWSTVVEDGKAMNQFIIASDIPVHREQLVSNGVFFDHDDHEKLAELMRTTDAKTFSATNNYDVNIKEFGKSFMQIVSKVITQ